MARLNRVQRRLLAEQLAAWLHEWIEVETSDVEFTVESGFRVAVADDLASAYREPNGTATLVIRINGGARDTGDLADDARADAA